MNLSSFAMFAFIWYDTYSARIYPNDNNYVSIQCCVSLSAYRLECSFLLPGVLGSNPIGARIFVVSGIKLISTLRVFYACSGFLANPPPPPTPTPHPLKVSQSFNFIIQFVKILKSQFLRLQNTFHFDNYLEFSISTIWEVEIIANTELVDLVYC